MVRKIDKSIKGIHTEKITNEPFDDVICHSVSKRKYFTIENNDIIYRRLREELKLYHLPYLGPCVDFGAGDICLEESNGTFKFYIIDRAAKFDYKEFDSIEDAINTLIESYQRIYDIQDIDKMKKIFYETLGLV